MNQQKITPVTAIMQREVSRKEFIAAIGLGMASVMGFANIIKLLTGKSVESHLKIGQKSSVGYGARSYGN